ESRRLGHRRAGLDLGREGELADCGHGKKLVVDRGGQEFRQGTGGTGNRSYICGQVISCEGKVAESQEVGRAENPNAHIVSGWIYKDRLVTGQRSGAEAANGKGRWRSFGST